MISSAAIDSARFEIGYSFEPLTPDQTARWDELIAPYAGRELFHRSVWLDYLAATRGVQIRHWAIRAGGQTVGYFCGGIIRIGPFRILGSPLRGWGTNVMAPLMNDEVDHSRLFAAFDRLARDERLAITEIENPILSEPALLVAGFESARDWTYMVSLTPHNPGLMWQALDSTCRNRIRKAEKAKLIVEDTDDPAAVDEYYDFYLQMMRRKGVTPPFRRNVPRLLVRLLKNKDSIFVLRVKDPSGRVLAVGLFPHDEHKIYFWSGASLPAGHALCPNEYLHWSAMRIAASRGIHTYNMSGYGRFKRKFGGTLIEVRRWHKCHWRSARWGRKGYALWFQGRHTLASLRLRLTSTPDRNGSEPTAAPAAAEFEPVTTSQRPSFTPSDIYRAPLHDFPIRDEILYQYLPLSRDMSVLEIGPGSGFTAFRLARQVRSLTLLEIAAGNIAQLRAKLHSVRNLTLVCADVCQPGLPSLIGHTFDAIYAIEVFEFVPDPKTSLENLAALLHPGGRLLLQFPNYPPLRPAGTTSFRTRAELESLLSNAGFAAWSISALRLRPFAAFLYEHSHEKPVRLFRRRRDDADAKPLTYDQVWLYTHGDKLEPFKMGLNLAWTALAASMRLGGPAFEHQTLGNDVLNRNLLVLARR